jgi:hypothetical protein
MLSAPIDAFGLPLAMPRQRAIVIVAALRVLWRRQTGRDFADLSRDLESLDRFFDPLATGQRLRQRLALVDAGSEPISSAIPPSCVAAIDESRALVTPEGRAVVECLDRALQGDGDPIVINQEWVAGLEHRLLDLYRSWSRRRLDDVLRLQRGEGPPMLPAAVGMVLLLLINGSTNESRAITRPDDPTHRRALDEAIARTVESFASAISPGSRSLEHFSVYSGYALTEARRRLSDHLANSPERLYVLPSHEEAVVRFLGRELARRSELSKERAAEAFDAFVREYHNNLPKLASLAGAYETPNRTGRIRSGLLSAFAARP